MSWKTRNLQSIKFNMHWTCKNQSVPENPKSLEHSLQYALPKTCKNKMSWKTQTCENQMSQKTRNLQSIKFNMHWTCKNKVSRKTRNHWSINFNMHWTCSIQVSWKTRKSPPEKVQYATWTETNKNPGKPEIGALSSQYALDIMRIKCPKKTRNLWSIQVSICTTHSKIKCPGKPEISGALSLICTGHVRIKCPGKPEISRALSLICTGHVRIKCRKTRNLWSIKFNMHWTCKNANVLENPKSLEH
jgi:hypothetical protein